MRTKFVFLIVLIVSIFSTVCVSQEKFTFGIKGGIGFWQFKSLQSSQNIGHPIDYSYPPGFCFGFYIENKFTKHFTVAGELLYQHCDTKVTIYTGYEGVLDQEIIAKYFTIPILLKYQTPQLWNAYFFLGPSLSYLIRADYNFYDIAYLTKGKKEITKDLSVISTSIEFGFGKEIEISKSNFSLELRVQWGVTKFKQEVDVGTWKNAGLIFLMGYKFN